MELHSAGPCYGTQQAAIMDHFVFRSLMGFFHAAWAYPCWVFPHLLTSAQHPIPLVTGRINLLLLIYMPGVKYSIIYNT